MAKITNISPLGDLIIPALNNLVVKAGETVDVSSEAAASLLEQTSNWASGDSSVPAASAPTETPSTAAPDSPVASA